MDSVEITVESSVLRRVRQARKTCYDAGETAMNSTAFLLVWIWEVVALRILFAVHAPLRNGNRRTSSGSLARPEHLCVHRATRCTTEVCTWSDDVLRPGCWIWTWLSADGHRSGRRAFRWSG